MQTFTLKGETFTSNLENREAIEAVAQLRSAFALSLASQYARKGTLSPKQWPWVHKLAADAVKPQASVKPQSVAVDCTEIVSLFDHASAKGMKRPRITFPEAKFSLAGLSSRRPGTIHVAQGSYPGKYFGYITREGQFVPGRDFASLDWPSWNLFPSRPASMQLLPAWKPVPADSATWN